MQLEEKYKWFRLLFFALPGVLLFLHAILTLSPKKALLFIFLASGTGTIMEYIGLKDGVFFGGHYIYKSQATLFTVPFNVILYWAVFIYAGYSIVNSFLYWLKQKKPNHKIGNYMLLLLTILLDGFVVVALDLFMDPIAVRMGEWKWLTGGAYFGVPIGNFVGWFIVVIIATGMFRVIEYFFPKKEIRYNKSIFIIPVLGYGMLAISFCFKALYFQMYDLVILGSLFMLSTVILNLFLFRKYKK
ncbi:MAG: carotenoid biosynthesis protein [bacterium]